MHVGNSPPHTPHTVPGTNFHPPGWISIQDQRNAHNFRAIKNLCLSLSHYLSLHIRVTRVSFFFNSDLYQALNLNKL